VVAHDRVGNETRIRVGPPPIDHDPPWISIADDGRAYRRDERLTLSCTVGDLLSGVVSSTIPCPAPGTPASRFAPGTYSYLVLARDQAGNEAARVATFTRLPEYVRVCDPPARVKVRGRYRTVAGACRTVVK
jgi:hypothetical protein